VSTSPDALGSAPISTPRRSHTIGIVSLITVGVAVLGYMREAALAARFGVGAATDAYFAAIFIPYNIYFILIVGTLSPVFIQIIWNRQIIEAPSEISETLSVIANFVFIALALVISAAMFTARWWLPWLFPGFDAPTTATALGLTYVILPAIPFLGLAGILTAALNGFHRFKLATFAPALTSIAVIVAIVLARGPRAIFLVGVATGIGFVLQFLLLIPRVSALGIRYRPLFRFSDPSIRRLLDLGAPLVGYLALANVSLLIERHLASQLSEGAVSSITYAMRLFTVPANFLAAPIAMVAYPHFAREAALPDHGELRSELARTLRYVFFIFLPVTIWTLLNALPITRILYEHGHFSLSDSIQVAQVLAIYAIGILPNAATLILLRCCYALQDTISPLVAESINLAIYWSLAVYLTHHYGIEGLASARTVAMIVVPSILLVALVRHKESFAPRAAAFAFALRVALATAGMAALTWAVLRLLQRIAIFAGVRGQVGVVVCSLAVGGLSFFAFAWMLRLRESTDMLYSARDFIALRLRARG
jgi:putative peptidoglycan lipid II flippase